MNRRTLAYWAATGLFSLALGASSVIYLTHQPFLVDRIHALGYPTHLVTLLGLAKGLGVVALLAPGFRRLKEWAYAGFTFDLIAAAWAHVSAGDGLGEIAPPVVLLAVLAVSYALLPARREAAARLAVAA